MTQQRWVEPVCCGCDTPTAATLPVHLGVASADHGTTRGRQAGAATAGVEGGGVPAVEALSGPAFLWQSSSTAEADITIIALVHPWPPPFPVNSFVVRLGGLPAEQRVVVGRHSQLHVPCVLCSSFPCGTAELSSYPRRASPLDAPPPQPAHPGLLAPGRLVTSFA
jgi:hypothetical protein